MFDQLKKQRFDITLEHHAEAILTLDMPEAIDDLQSVLATCEIPISELVGSGGGASKFTQRLRSALTRKNWKKHNFEVKKTIDGFEKESRSHEVDHVKRFEKGAVALEIEWNNKDPFFDRDLENFQRLHAEGAISVGVIITRGSSLQSSLPTMLLRFAERNEIDGVDDLKRLDLNPTQRQLSSYNAAAESYGTFAKGWAQKFFSDKFGESTTHWRKLADRVDRGVGNPCPLALIGIPDTVIKE